MAMHSGVVPMIAYEDGVAALEWLASSFGFIETDRILDEGRLAHGQMETGHGTIMLANPTPDYQGPRHHRQECATARRWSEVPYLIDGVLVYVDDVDAHFERAKDSGVSILTEIEDGPVGRRYRAEDLEGHRWMFLQVGADD